jgi:hypothetical protein
VFGAAYHPQDYYPDPMPIRAWLSFIAAQDPNGIRNRTPCEILSQEASSVSDPVPGSFPFV